MPRQAPLYHDPILASVSRTTTYYVQRALGSTRLVLSARVSTIYSTNYKPYGLEYCPTGTATYKYTGQLLDSATGLYYLHARYYDPDLGRFISVDPVSGKPEIPQSLNRYTYGLNNPLRYTDPSGKDWWNPWTWTPQQQAWALAAVVVVVSAIAIALTLGAAAPVLAPYAAIVVFGALTASSSAVIYTATAGSKATPGGVIENAGAGLAIGAGLGLLGSFGPGESEPGLIGEEPGMLGQLESGEEFPNAFEDSNFAPRQLAEHFAKHGPEEGFVNSEQEYLGAARSLLSKGVNGEADLYWRNSGDLISVDSETGAMAIFDTESGFIRTLFTPNGLNPFDYIKLQIANQGWEPLFG